ncbi:5442_t:CDS:2, partial [Cetraspora pellucida]
MADERERMKQITTELAALEKDDTLARLLTGKEICVAIYQWGGELFIASNKSEPKYAKKYLLVLQRFANSLAQEDYEQLLELAIRKIYSLKVKETATSRRQKFQYKKYKAKGEIIPNRPSALAQIQEQAQQLFQEIKKLTEEKVVAKVHLASGEIEEERAEYEKKSKYNENNDWEYLSLIEDTNIITKAIYEQKLDKKLLAIIKKGANIQYIDESVEEAGVHAEMKILAALHARGKLGKSGGYIGITKLCFPSNIPDKYKVQLLSELEKLLLPKKVSESTSVVPSLLTKSCCRELEQGVYESQVGVGTSLPK